MVICLERGADLHMAQLMPLPLTVFCFSEIQNGFTFLIPAQLGSPGQRAVKRVCVCVYVCVCLPADRGAEYYDERVCVCVCLSAIISSELHVLSSPHFCTLPMAVAPSSSGGV